MTISSPAAPAVSVVLASDTWETIRAVVAHMRDLDAAPLLELVFTATDPQSFADRRILQDFAAVRIVQVDAVIPLSSPRALAIAACRSPLVFIGETHSFPQQGFFEKMIEVHREDWDIVVPGFENANPDRLWSRISFLTDYGSWLAVGERRSIPVGPSYNAVFKRSLFDELGTAVEDVISQGDGIKRYQRSEGWRVLFEPTARIRHLNLDTLGLCVRERYYVGQCIAGKRFERWSRLRSSFYAAASPLIAIVLWARSVRGLPRSSGLPLGTRWLMAIGAIARACGEAVGYVRGASSSTFERAEHYEVYKSAFLSPRSK